MNKTVKFSRGAHADFIRVLRSRVTTYFEENRISKFGDTRLLVKTLFMFSLLFGPWTVLMFGEIANAWLVVGLFALMGLGTAGIGFSVMHDACHGSYSRYPWVNKVLSYTMNLIGGNARNWKMQHNVLHHSFTNIEGMDDDIAPPEILLRFSPHAKRYWIHRMQHIYGWLLYGLETILWCTVKDFTGLFKYRREGLLKKSDGPFALLIADVLIWKLIYFTYTLVLPLLFVPVAWWVVLIGWLTMHFITGFVLAIVFQSAHVMPEMEFPLPDDDGMMETDWAVHQVLTTTNFSPRSRIFSWFIGGLNYQIEHHLFPNISHVHYPNISSIVKQTTKEFGLPYHSKKYFIEAVADHARMLYLFGRYDVIPVRSN